MSQKPHSTNLTTKNLKNLSLTHLKSDLTTKNKLFFVVKSKIAYL